MSLRVRLLAAFALIGAVVVGSAGAALALSRSSSAALLSVSQSTLPAQRSTIRVRSAATASAAALRGYVITSDPELLTELRGTWREYQAAAPQARQTCGATAGDCALVAEQDALMRRWYKAYADPVLAGRQSLAQASISYPQARLLLSQFIEVNDRALAELDEQMDADLELAAQHRRGGWWLVVASVVLAGVGLLALATVTVREVVPPLNRLREALGRLAAGDLTARVEMDGPRELRAVASSVNRLAEQSLWLREADLSRAEDRRATRELDTRMRRHLHPDAVAEEAVNGLGPMLSVDRVHVRFIDQGRMGPVAAQRTTQALSEVAQAAPVPTDAVESATAVAARGQTSMLLEADGDGLHEVGRSVRLSTSVPSDYAGVTSAVLVPVVVGQERLGVLVCARGAGRPAFDRADQELVESIAGDLARAVQHARLFEQQSSVVGQLRELDRRKSDFLSTISHELRTPLTSIAGYVELLRDGDAGPLQPMQDSMLETVARNTQRLRALIEDVLLISRVEAGTVRNERMPVAVGGIIDHVVTALRPQAEAGQVAMDVFPISDDALVLGDPAQIDRLLLNLLGNAVKFTPPNGRVSISVEVTDDHVVLYVQDTGIGIPADELDSLFTRFFRASNATERQIPGTGLGLTIIAGIVAAHDGRIDVESAPNDGTTFTVTLTRWDPDDLAALTHSSNRL